MPGRMRHRGPGWPRVVRSRDYWPGRDELVEVLVEPVPSPGCCACCGNVVTDPVCRACVPTAAAAAAVHAARGS